mmetsp:Transcript_39279/g.78156  ORF Transcript_39279/g.78156 Transcript_39279/m.78156 type:complete len:331 (+) Transcript_39279:93-1085(+)
MALALNHHRVKEIADWTPADVRAFLESILPGHPSLDFFTYTSGFVLESLEKEDLRRQARDEEAANVIWAQLRLLRSPRADESATAAAPGVVADGLAGACLARSLDFGQGQHLITVYVKTRQEAALELEVLPDSMVADLKELIADREGTPKECQRLVAQGLSMQDDRTLQSYNVRHGSHILLVPQLREHGTQAPRMFAPRGPLMVPGSTAWHPKPACGRPYLPVLCRDVSRPFPVSLEFASTADAEAFSMAAQHKEPPVLEIQPTRSDMPPIETRLYLDSGTGGAVMDAGGDLLAASSEYTAIVHFGGRGGHVEVVLHTGAAAVSALSEVH